MYKIDECPVCFSKKLSVWGGEHLKCDVCGIVTRRELPEEDELDRMYSEYYSSVSIESDSTHMLSADYALKNHAVYIDLIASTDNNILDYGAGTGDLVNILKNKGYDVDGCEFSLEARNAAYTKYGYEFKATLDDFKGKEYDIITAVEVIEHLQEPLISMEKVFSLLKPGGVAYITTPNTNGLKARVQRSEWNEAKKPFHLILFNNLSLKKLSEKAGFSKTKYIWYSPLTSSSIKQQLIHRSLQTMCLYGGLRVLCYK